MLMLNNQIFVKSSAHFQNIEDKILFPVKNSSCTFPVYSTKQIRVPGSHKEEMKSKKKFHKLYVKVAPARQVLGSALILWTRKLII